MGVATGCGCKEVYTVAVKKTFPNYSPFTVHVVLEW